MDLRELEATESKDDGQPMCDLKASKLQRDEEVLFRGAEDDHTRGVIPCSQA